METRKAPDTPLGRWREAAGLSPQEAANHIGVTLPMWSRWEREVRDVPAVRVLEIEKLTGVSRHELRSDVFGATPKPTPSQAERAA